VNKEIIGVKNTVVAGIVVYNPNLNKLLRNIKSIINQVGQIVIFDNNSDNCEQIKKICEQQNITYLKNIENVGIATGFNEIFNLLDEKYKWIITLDQDSECPSDYIEKASRYFGFEHVGIITTSYIERNLGKPIKKINTTRKYEYVSRAITSAAVVNRKAYDVVNGYDNNFFVDYVDFDFSVRIKLAGYKILQMNDVNFFHEVGKSSMRRFLFWKFRMTSHSVNREYNIGKNITIFIKKYRRVEDVSRDFLSLMKHFVLALTYDTEKIKKTKALVQGVMDGLKTRVTPY